MSYPTKIESLSFKPLETKRLMKLLGIQQPNLRSSHNVIMPKQEIHDKSKEDQQLHSPVLLKKVKVEPQTAKIDAYDDLRCTEEDNTLNDANIISQNSNAINNNSNTITSFPKNNNQNSVSKMKLQKQKKEYEINCGYLSQYNINEYSWKSRAIIIQRIIDDGKRMNFTNNTIFYAIEYFDRFMERMPRKVISSSNQLRYLSIVLLWIAAKMNEHNCPANHQFTVLSTLQMTNADLLNYELVALRVLNFNLRPITAFDHLIDLIYGFALFNQKLDISFESMRIKECINKLQQDVLIKISVSILYAIMSDSNNLKFKREYLCFALLYIVMERETGVERERFMKYYDQFLVHYGCSLRDIEDVIVYVEKFYRIHKLQLFKSINRCQYDVKAIEIFKLVHDQYY